MRTVAAPLRLTLELPPDAFARNHSQVTVTEVIPLPYAHEAFVNRRQSSSLGLGQLETPNNYEYDELTL
jgi:hypothetical protein